MNTKGTIKKIYKKTAKTVKNFFYPDDLMVDPDSFTKEQIKALSDRRTISKMLFYRSYVEPKDGKAGFYIQADGRVGIIFRLYPPPFLLSQTEKDIINLLNTIALDDTVINIMTYASRDIHRTIQDFEELHSRSPNVKHPDILKEFTEDTIEYYKKWTQESIAGKESDLRVRNFVHTLSILFPYDTDDFIINQQYNQILGMFKEYSIRPLEPDEFIPIVREILNPGKGEYGLSNDSITTINKQMTKDTYIKLLDKENLLETPGGWKTRVLTTDKYPRAIDIFTFQNIFFNAMGDDFQINLPCPFMLSLTVQFRNTEKMKKRVLSKARWNLGQLSGMPPLIYKKRPHIKERRDENEEVIQYIENLGEIPLEAFLTLTISEKDINKLEQFTSSIKKSFEQVQGRWIIKEEKFPQIAYQTFLMSLPLQYSEIIHKNIDKFDKNFKSNNAQMSPLIGGYAGNGRPYHIYIDRTGQEVSLDFFNSENYNIIVIGPMGSGKSMWANAFLGNAVNVNWQIRMIDFGRSYKKFSENIGGQFLEFTPENNICMNFFTEINTNEFEENGEKRQKIAGEEIEMLVPIVGYMAGLNLQDIYKDINSSPEDKLNMTVLSVMIAKAINRAFEIKGRDAGMREVREALIDFKEKAHRNDESYIVSELGKMIVSLEPYADPKGPYFKYFNGASNIKFKNSYFVLELDDISTSPVMPVIAMLYLQKTAREAFIEYEKDKSTRRIVGVDEAWKVLDNPLFAKFLEDFARRIRKYFGITLVITQSVDEFFQNPQAEVIYKTADWKIYLPHSRDAIESSLKTGKVNLNDFEIKLFKSLSSRLPHFGEFFLKHKKVSTVLLLKLSPLAYWLFTSNPKDRAKLESIEKKYKLSTQKAIIYLAKKAEGLSEDEIFELFSSKNKKNTNLDWEEFFKTVIQQKSIKVRREPIVNLNNNTIEFYENLPSLIYNNMEYFPKDFFYKAKELGYSLKIKKIFYQKAIEASTEDMCHISLNISLEGMRNKKFKNFLFALFKKLQYKLYLEIRLDYKAEEVQEAIEFGRNINNEKLNVGIVFDNVDFNTISLSSLVEFSPENIKINIENIKRNQENQIYINMIKSLEKSFKIKTIITFIETEEDFNLAKKLGMKYLQGYYIAENYKIFSTQPKSIPAIEFDLE